MLNWAKDGLLWDLGAGEEGTRVKMTWDGAPFGKS